MSAREMPEASRSPPASEPGTPGSRSSPRLGRGSTISWCSAPAAAAGCCQRSSAAPGATCTSAFRRRCSSSTPTRSRHRASRASRVSRFTLRTAAADTDLEMVNAHHRGLVAGSLVAVAFGCAASAGGHRIARRRPQPMPDLVVSGGRSGSRTGGYAARSRWRTSARGRPRARSHRCRSAPVMGCGRSPASASGDFRSRGPGGRSASRSRPRAASAPAGTPFESVPTSPAWSASVRSTTTAAPSGRWRSRPSAGRPRRGRRPEPPRAHRPHHDLDLHRDLDHVHVEPAGLDGPA